MKPTCRFRWLGQCEYQVVANRMSAFTDERHGESADEVWFLEHRPVFTLGTSSQQKPRINPCQIPVVRSNRGGQITFHGPGQLIAYLLLDIRRLGMGPRQLVARIEACLLCLLQEYGLQGERKPGAPGVYVQGAKIAALGLRIRRGCCFHGLSLNVDLEITPFSWIDPCGDPGLPVTTLVRLGAERTMDQVRHDLQRILRQEFGWEESRNGSPAAAV